jgi:hypothetical protein
MARARQYRYEVDWRRLYREGLSDSRGLPFRASVFIAPYSEREVLAVALVPWDAAQQDQARALIWGLGRLISTRGATTGWRDALGAVMRFLAERQG